MKYKAMNITDIVGLDYKRAREILEKKNIKIVNIEITAPPRYKKGDYNDSFRILRVEPAGEGEVKILVCDPFVG